MKKYRLFSLDPNGAIKKLIKTVGSMEKILKIAKERKKETGESLYIEEYIENTKKNDLYKSFKIGRKVTL